jgi:hypothetical protein
MIKLIAFREDTWFAPLAEYNLYNHISIAYNVQFQLIRDWSEAEIPEGHLLVVAHETGSIESKDFDHPSDNVVYVFGRTGLHLLGNVPNPDSVIRIDTPGSSDGVFGHQVAAIILRDRQIRGL